MILIDAELYVISPHLPSRCLKQRVEAANSAEQTAANTSNSKRRKSILSEPNLRVDGHTDCIPKRNRKSDRIRQKHLARVEATLDDDENDGEEEQVQNENIVIQVRSRPDEWVPNATENDEIIIEVDESDEEHSVDVKDEDEIKQEIEGEKSEEAETERSLSRNSRVVAKKTTKKASRSKIPIDVEANANLQAVYLENQLANDRVLSENDVEETLHELISRNVNDQNDLNGDVADQMLPGYDNLLTSTENDPLMTELVTAEPHAKSKVVVRRPPTKMRVTKRKSWTENYVTDNRSKVICDICNESMAKNRILSHIRFVHLGLRTMSNRECDICGSIYSNVGNLRQHRRRHTHPKPYTCTFCGKGFSGQFHLNEHMNLHLNLKPYKCDECDKWFSRATMKKSHMRIHTGEKPYKCKIVGCERDFRYNSDLRRHLYSVHDILHTKHVCHICNTVFPERKLLKRHLERHLKKTV